MRDARIDCFDKPVLPLKTPENEIENVFEDIDPCFDPAPDMVWFHSCEIFGLEHDVFDMDALMKMEVGGYEAGDDGLEGGSEFFERDLLGEIIESGR